MKKARVIGLMSGTSLDGLDIVAVDFNHKEKLDYQIIASECIPYDAIWLDKLSNAHCLSSTDLMQLDAAYGKWLGNQVNQFIAKNKLTNIDFISSHGHTIFHQPDKGYTLQIGNGAHIQSITGTPTICDFRSQDVALGGQGAPLVPIGDQLLFSEYDACVNLGGFANISFEHDNHRIAFDICPVNYVINHLAQRIGQPYDDKGEIAKSYPADYDLIISLNGLDFYQNKPPKSLGREWVEQYVFPLLNPTTSAQELIATFTQHVAHQTVKVIHEYDLKRILFTGGGCRNDELIRIIQSKTTAEIIIGDEQLVDYKEALIFAFLGWLRSQNKINVLSSVTGAIRDSSSGVIYI